MLLGNPARLTSGFPSIGRDILRPMKPDLYTKVVLTVIAVMLSLIVCNQFLNPTSTAQAADAKFASMQFNGGPYSFTMFDTRTGDIWGYTDTHHWSHAKVVEPGQPVGK